MDDLVQFLRARLDEDEQAARRAGDSFRQIGETGVIVATEGDRAEECASANWAGVAAHIVRHDPARVLCEIDAKRQIAEQHRPVGYGDVCLSYCHTRTPSQPASWPCLTLRLLALPFADHPDYSQKWRP